MTPQIIANILGLLERVQLTGREVPAFNEAVGSLLQEREILLKGDITPKEESAN